ncbi:hypothetical protein BDZ45DRAFT_776489 [Acephala macrosclerotiorum]|nr:hypothetical protein BDZ45DRAFT_776489 [Acephala macrosclerotiorum]
MPQVYPTPASPLPDSQILANTSYGFIPGENSYYSIYPSKSPSFPANITTPILNTTASPTGPDDLISFTTLGLPNTTYQHIVSIRDNEAGYPRIFQDQISSNSVKPGAYRYSFPFTSMEEFLTFQNLIEISSMAFLTRLVQQDKLNIRKGASTAVAETEIRHLVWRLIDVWNVDLFAGPSDISFPYANQILDTTNRFTVPGSRSSANPSYPFPSQHLPAMAITNITISVTLGSSIQIQFKDAMNQPSFKDRNEYYTVWFHGVENITVPFNTRGNETVIPATFEKGLIIGVLVDEEGATMLESVVAGPIFLLQQPSTLGTILAL